MANFLTGSYIEVLYTDNTVARFPNQIGCLGIVEHAPIHPSTWFTIKMMDGRSIKLQTTAMKHVSKNDSRHQMAQSILLLPVQKQPTVIHATPTGEAACSNNDVPIYCKTTNNISSQGFEAPNIHFRPNFVSTDIPKENHRPRSNSNLGISHFTKGVSVIILRTDNVLHRVPHLVGVVGVIKEVPVHPITWFKIEFPSGQVATFRPSAFKLNDGKDEEVHRPSKKPTAFSASFNQIYAKKNQPSKEKDRSSEHDYAIGMQVVIRSGELRGELGEVLKASNGWIQVSTPLGRVAKRAHELEYTGHTFEGRDPLSPAPKDERRFRPNSESKAQKKTFMSFLKEGSPQAERCHYFQKSFPDFAQNASSVTGSKRTHQDFTHAGSDVNCLVDREDESSDCPFPLLPLHIRQVKRQKFQAFIEREWEMNSSRPDLTYWLQEIKGALSDEIYEDPYKKMPMRPRVGEVIITAAVSSSPVAPCNEEYYTEAETESVAETCADDTRQLCPNSPSSSLSLMDHDGEMIASHHDSLAPTGTARVPVPVAQSMGIESPSEEVIDIYDIESEGEVEVEKRDRSNSMYAETDSEETFSPDQPSHVNVHDFPERSVPSPLNLPPPGTNFNNFTSKECSLNSINYLQTIDTIDSMSRGEFVTLTGNNERSQSRSTYTYQLINKSEQLPTIPTPGAVKVFLPRQYSCPTFSPFQTSSFSPFTLNTNSENKGINKLSISKEKDDIKKFFESNKKNQKHNGSHTNFMSSAFLPFHPPIPTGSNV